MVLLKWPVYLSLVTNRFFYSFHPLWDPNLAFRSLLGAQCFVWIFFSLWFDDWICPSGFGDGKRPITTTIRKKLTKIDVHYLPDHEIKLLIWVTVRSQEGGKEKGIEIDRNKNRNTDRHKDRQRKGENHMGFCFYWDSGKDFGVSWT